MIGVARRPVGLPAEFVPPAAVEDDFVLGVLHGRKLDFGWATCWLVTIQAVSSLSRRTKPLPDPGPSLVNHLDEHGSRLQVGQAARPGSARRADIGRSGFDSVFFGGVCRPDW